MIIFSIDGEGTAQDTWKNKTNETLWMCLRHEIRKWKYFQIYLLYTGEYIYQILPSKLLRQEWEQETCFRVSF